MEMKPKENNAGQSLEGPNEAAESGTEGQLIRESEHTNKVEATDQAVYCLRQLCMECIKAGMFFCFDYLEMVHDMGMQMKQ